jgi:hypothetical protein
MVLACSLLIDQSDLARVMPRGAPGSVDTPGREARHTTACRQPFARGTRRQDPQPRP